MVLNMTVVEWLQATEKRTKRVRPRAWCPDGFNVSIQFGDGWYCNMWADTRWGKHFEKTGDITPWVYTEDEYETVELGYPSEKIEEWMKYCEDEKNPLDTVYGYVPIETVQEVIKKHGGIDYKKSIAHIKGDKKL